MGQVTCSMAEINQLRRKIVCEKKDPNRVQPNLCHDVKFRKIKIEMIKYFASGKIAFFFWPCCKSVQWLLGY